MNTKMMIFCTVLAVAVILQTTPADAGWGSCISMWKTEYGIATVSDVQLVRQLKSRQGVLSHFVSLRLDSENSQKDKIYP